MVTTAEEYPVWRTMKPIIVPRNEPHTYMYALFEGGRFKRWEKVSSMPRVVLCSDPVTEVHDFFNGPSGYSGKSSIVGSSLMAESLRGGLPTGTRLYVVCFHLPVRLTGGKGHWQAEWNESLIAKTEDSVAQKLPTHWVGTVNLKRDEELTEEEMDQIRAILRPMDCTPLFISKAVQSEAYYGYCKQMLWPAFHNVDVLDLSEAGNNTSGSDVEASWEQATSNLWWKAYDELNSAFADQIVGMLKDNDNDVIWVHDYHLMLLPKMLSERQKLIPGCKRTHSVFYLHIPFPTSQIFRSLPQGEELLQASLGMLSATVVGFHAFDHARHFLNACKRLLGLSYQSIKGGLIGVEHDRRTVMVVMSHVGVEPHSLDQAAQRPYASLAAEAIKIKHPNRLILGGLDTCQKLSGVALKLMAYERLLMEYPSRRNQVVLVQYCLKPANRLDDEAQTSLEIDQLVKRISETYGEEVIDYQEEKAGFLNMDKRMSLYLSSDVWINTAVREGLNLIPLEYTYAKNQPGAPGVVLASEFSACSSLLNGAIRINPFDVQGVAAAMELALSMDVTERTGRRARDLPYISSRPSAKWTHRVLLDMCNMSKEALVTHMEDTSLGGLTNEMSLEGFTPLDIEQVAASYARTSRRVLLFDFGGTLKEKEALGKYLKREISSVTGRQLDADTHSAVVQLCADPNNMVFIISGLHTEGLLQALGDIPHLGLAANNGLAFSWPHGAGGSNEREWEVFDYGVDWEQVKYVSIPLLNKFMAHTNGSNIRDTGVAWSYYSTDPEWGQMQAKQLTAELETALAAYDVKVQHVRGQVEVVPKRLHKGVVAKAILKGQLKRWGHYPDFVLCVGDDVSDENMFTSIFSFLADVDTYEPGTPEYELKSEADNTRVYTCTVGKKPSHASFFLDETSEVRKLVRALATMDGMDA
ncbi:unnamed protein product [Chrysoparadoxa australica]